MTGPAGLPLGYDHTETGAVQAATSYLTWMNSIRIKDKAAADSMAEATAADPATRAAMIESFDALRTGPCCLMSIGPGGFLRCLMKKVRERGSCRSPIRVPLGG